MEYDIAFRRGFLHTDWLDAVDRVSAGGDNGFNTRFHALESDLDGLGARVADINAALNTGRDELYASLGTLTADGGADTPDGQFGFKVFASTTPNGILVRIGPGVIGGRPITPRGLTFYTEQPWTDPATAAAAGVAVIPPLTTPTANRTDLVYLDMWEHSTTRIEREVAIRVVEGATVLPATPAGHTFLAIAQLHRRAGVAVIPQGDIEDRRPLVDRSGTTRVQSLLPFFVPDAEFAPWTSRSLIAEATPGGRTRGFLQVHLPQHARLVSIDFHADLVNATSHDFIEVSFGRISVAPSQLGDFVQIGGDIVFGQGTFNRTITVAGGAGQNLDLVETDKFSYWIFSEAELPAGTAHMRGLSVRYVS